MFFKALEVTNYVCLKFRFVSFLTIVAVFILVGFQVSIADEKVIDDGYTDQELAEIFSQTATSNFTQTSQEYYRGIIIVDSTRPNAYFGISQLSLMNDIGWDLFKQTIDWSINYQDHATTKICLITLEAIPYSDEDAFAAYNFLIDSMGFDSTNIFFWENDSLANADYSSFDLILHVNASSWNIANVFSQNIPFVTLSQSIARDMGILTNLRAGNIHETIDYAYINDNSHSITANYNIGKIMLNVPLMISNSYVSGNGVALVTADDGQFVPPAFISVYNDFLSPLLYIGDIAPVSIYYYPGLATLESAGFELLISYDTERLSVNSISQGALLDSCQWDFFTYSVDSEADCGGEPCPEGIIRIVALADDFTFGSPLCNISTSGSLVDIEFQVTSDSSYECSNAPINFYWTDCGDNSFSSILGDTTFISRNVLDRFFNPLIAKDTTFPTLFGTPSECSVGNNSTQQRLYFLNRGVFIEGCIYEPIIDIGDINLNQIANEIADAVLFANYFIWGVDVFTVDQEEQILSTDVNSDDLTLTLDDYVYLWRIIYGDVSPFPSLPSVSAVDTVLFVQDTLNKKVSLTYSDSIRAIYLVFEGDLRPWGLGDDTTDTNLPFDGTHTRVLMDVYLSQNDSLFLQDSLFYYTGEGKLVGAFACFDGISPLPTAIEGGSGSCCVNRGNVNGDLSGFLDISDLVTLVSYQFASGSTPPCLDEADISGDWSVDILDIIFFVNYMFNSGPPPPPCQ